MKVREVQEENTNMFLHEAWDALNKFVQNNAKKWDGRFPNFQRGEAALTDKLKMHDADSSFKSQRDVS